MCDFWNHIVKNNIAGVQLAFMHTTAKDACSGMVHAVQYKHTDIACYLLSQGVSTELRCPESNTLLMIAIENNDVVMVDMLIQHGAFINSENFITHHTPLILAVLKKNTDMVRRLIHHGANSSFQKLNEKNALMHAVHTRDIDMVKCLIDLKIEFIFICNQYNDFAITLAVENNDIEMTKLLLTHYASKCTYACKSALSIIVYERRTELLQLMLDFGVDSNSVVVYSPLLIWIVKSNWMDGLQIILNPTYAVNVNAMSARQETALYIAIVQHSVEMVEMLLKADANVNSPVHNISLLSLTCSQVNLWNITQLLIQYGADVNGCFYNETILMTATKSGHINVIKLLLLKGARVHDMTKINECMYNIRSDVVYKQVVELFEDVNTCRETNLSTLECNVRKVREINYNVWFQLLSSSIQDGLTSKIQCHKQDEYACYTALYEGEDAVLKKFRQGEMVSFSEAKIRGMFRPMGVRHLRRLLTSYLVYDTQLRSIFTTMQMYI